MSKSSPFQSVRFQLLFSYLGIMAATLGFSFLAVERWVVYDLNQQFNDYLLELAEAASQTLEIVKHESNEQEEGEYEQEATKEHYQHYYPETYPKLADLMTPYQRQGTLAIQQYHPLYFTQGVEWFDENKNLLVQEGNLLINRSLSEHLKQFNPIVEQDQIRSLVLPVFYTPPRSETQELSGYIRTSHGTEMLETQLKRLRLGLVVGGIIAFGFTTLGAFYLTQKSLQPIQNSFEKLKQFTADASHELRSPLTVIKSSISVLQSHPERIHSMDKNKIKAIGDASDRMTRLVEDLLLLARLEGSVSVITLENIPIPIDEVLEDTIEFAQSEADKKQINLHSTLQSNVWVLGDGQQLQRVFSNLIENGLQYTPIGGTITVSLFTNNGDAIITVEDTGIGIASEELPHVFDRLWRSQQARTERYEGTGLGMAIALSLIQAHGGTIEVTSQLGVGSCFWVQLPLKPS